MSQSNFNIPNEAGASFRSDNNNALQSLATLSSGATAPATTYAYQWWRDTTNNLLKMRNGSNTAWVTLGDPLDTAKQQFYVNGVVKMTILASGNVGLGTTTAPAYALDVPGDINCTGNIRVNGSILSTGQQHGQCRLVKSGANIVLLPCNGNKVMVNGTVYTIPSSGVSLAPTGLTVGALLYVYLYDNASVLTLEASTTGHSTDTTTGVEIKTGAATRTLVGMVRPITGPAFADTDAQRFVATWFNRPSKRAGQVITSGTNFTTTSYTEVTTNLRSEFLIWGDEVIDADIVGIMSNGTAATAVGSAISFNSGTVEPGMQSAQTGAGQRMNAASNAKKLLTEGYNYMTVFGYVQAGTGTLNAGDTPATGFNLSGYFRS